MCCVGLNKLLYHFAMKAYRGVRECLLLLGAESFVFQFTIQNSKDQDIQNYNFAHCPVWV